MKVSSLAGKKSSGKAVWIAVAAVCLLIALAAVWFYLAVYPYSTPEKTALRYVTAIGKRDLKAAFSCMTEKDRARVSAASAPSLSTLPGAGASTPEYRVGKVEITGDKAVVPISLKLPAGMAQFGLGDIDLGMRLALVKEGMTWRIEMEETGRLMMESSRQLMEKLAKKYPGQLPAPGFSAPPAPPGR